MHAEPLSRRLLAEGIGSMTLTATVVGSGVMAQRLAAGNVAIALLANAAATVLALYVLISLFGRISGAHFNPAVTIIDGVRGRKPRADICAYAAIQIFGCCLGTLLAHVMFELPLLQVATHVRTGPAQWISESIATCGLLLVVIGRHRAEDAPVLVACWIGAAYWFTASTSFANPAITIARSLTDSFVGIRPIDVPAFVIAQMAGAFIALILSRWLFQAATAKPNDA